MPIFRRLTRDACVGGLALLKGGTPHYDVLVADGTRLAAALATSFRLDDKYTGDAKTRTRFHMEKASQEVMSTAEVEALFFGENLADQGKLFEVR